MTAHRVWAWPLVPVYAAGLAVRDGLRRVGLLRTRRLQWPVISVGSLSAGGAGKTPVVIALVELLRERGWMVDVLSRGYGREGRGVERVNLEVADPAARFGDEPVVIAERTGVPVWIGSNRFAAGEAAEGAAQAEGGRLLPQTITHPSAENAEGWGTRSGGAGSVHLLDDGFQHRGLARSVDVVLVTAEDIEDWLLPAGNRREPLAALRRAAVVVLREKERGRVQARLRGLIRSDTVVWSVRRELRFTDFPGAGRAGSRLLAFCGIARPEDLWAMLAEAGCEMVDRVAFGDHHAYASGDIEWMIERAKELGAEGFITTEKDAVKLVDSPHETMLRRLREVGPVCVVGLTARFVDEADVLQTLEERMR